MIAASRLVGMFLLSINFCSALATDSMQVPLDMTPVRVSQHAYYVRFHGSVVSALVSQQEFEKALPLAEHYVVLATRAKDELLSCLLAATIYAQTNRELDARQHLEGLTALDVDFSNFTLDEKRWLRDAATVLIQLDESQALLPE